MAQKKLNQLLLIFVIGSLFFLKIGCIHALFKEFGWIRTEVIPYFTYITIDGVYLNIYIMTHCFVIILYNFQKIPRKIIKTKSLRKNQSKRNEV